MRSRLSAEPEHRSPTCLHTWSPARHITSNTAIKPSEFGCRSLMAWSICTVAILGSLRWLHQLGFSLAFKLLGLISHRVQLAWFRGFRAVSHLFHHSVLWLGASSSSCVRSVTLTIHAHTHTHANTHAAAAPSRPCPRRMCCGCCQFATVIVVDRL